MGKTTFDKAFKSIHKHLIPSFGTRHYQDISPKEWFDFFQGLQRNLGIHTQVEKLVSYVRSSYDWAKFQGHIQTNLLENMSKHLDKYESENMHFVEINELLELIRKIRSNKKRTIGIGLELLILLFPGPSELRCAKWAEFNLAQAIFKSFLAHG